MTKLDISKGDVSVLKNFSEINNSIVFFEGTTIKTCNESKSIIGVYNLKDEDEKDKKIVKEFAIYNLQEFVKVLSLFDEGCYLEFLEDNGLIDVKFSDRSNKMRYNTSKTEIVKKRFNVPETKFPLSDYQIRVSEENIKKWKSVSKTFGFDYIRFNNVKNKATITVFDSSSGGNKNKDFYSEETTAFNASSDLDLYMRIDDLLILSGDYEIEVSSKNFCRFNNMDEGLDLSYYIALESKLRYHF